LQVAQISSGLFLLVLQLGLCHPALAQAPNWHDGLHLARFKPRSIDSKAIMGASTAQIVLHAVPERGLAAAASTPAPSEFVSAAATYFQVCCNQLVPALIVLIADDDALSYARCMPLEFCKAVQCSLFTCLST